ncbi:MAG TPA: HdeD family acid-resistance protein [Acetobacteraceae bacterium]|jgi:uncharacterized membrane protein HdeD (DUF308 family)
MSDVTIGLDRAGVLMRNWWLVALRGAVAILFGLMALLLPGVTLGSLVLLFGIYMLVDGISAIWSGVRAAAHHQRWGWLILEGVLDLITAAIALVLPIATILALVYLSAAWALLSGISLLVAAFGLHVAGGRWLMVLSAVISIIWGVLLFISPVAGAVVMTWWLGAYAIIFGVALLALAWKLRQAGRDGGTMAPAHP